MHTESKIASSEATNWRWFLTALTVIIVIAIIIMIAIIIVYQYHV